MKALKTFFVTALLLIFQTAAQAATYNIDPAHSSIGFTAKHLVVSNIQGGFGDFAGTLNFDPADLSSFKAEATIQAKSIDTRNQQRDDHLRSAEFFDVEKYPTITF